MPAPNRVARRLPLHKTNALLKRGRKPNDRHRWRAPSHARSLRLQFSDAGGSGRRRGDRQRRVDVQHDVVVHADARPAARVADLVLTTVLEVLVAATALGDDADIAL